jgi:hypothetical protein
MAAEPKIPAWLCFSFFRATSLLAAEQAGVGQHGRDHLIVHLSREQVIPRREAILERVVQAKGR